MNKTEGSEDARQKIEGLRPNSGINALVQREKIRIRNTRGRTKDPRDTILLYAAVVNEVTSELSLRRNPEDIHLLEKLIWIEAHAREWVE